MQLCFNLNTVHSCVGKALRTKPNGSVIIYGGGRGALNINVFLGKNCANPTIKKSKHFLPNLKYQLQKLIPMHPCPKNMKRDAVVTRVFCSLNFHVLCTCTFSGDTNCLLTNRPEMIKTATLIDSHIVLTYDC